MHRASLAALILSGVFLSCAGEDKGKPVPTKLEVTVGAHAEGSGSQQLILKGVTAAGPGTTGFRVYLNPQGNQELGPDHASFQGAIYFSHPTGKPESFALTLKGEASSKASIVLTPIEKTGDPKPAKATPARIMVQQAEIRPSDNSAFK